MRRSRLVMPIVTLAILFGVFAVAHSSRGTMAVLTDNISSDEQYFEAGFWESCTYTLGYWKTHPEAWPVEEIPIGGVTYTKTQAVEVLETQPRGDATYLLAHQLIAAKLNISNGADPSAVETTIAEADTWLVEHPLGSKPKGPERQEGIALAQTLDDYNKGAIGPGHCDDQTPTPTPDSPIQCSLEIGPDPLILTGEGNPVTAHIELPADLDVNDIDVYSILLEGTIPALSVSTEIGDYVPTILLKWLGDSTLERLGDGLPADLLTEIGDYDGDGIPDLMVLFDRFAVVAMLNNLSETEGRSVNSLSDSLLQSDRSAEGAMLSSQASEVTLTLAGETIDGLAFEGSDTITLEPMETPTATATVAPTASPTLEPTLEPTLTPTPEPTTTPTSEPTAIPTPGQPRRGPWGQLQPQRRNRLRRRRQSQPRRRPWSLLRP